MKLRLPSKLVAAIMAAASSATFATLATGSTAYGETTYTDLTTSDYFEANANVYNTGKGTFFLETETCELNLTLTLNLNAFAAYQGVHDYANAGYYSPFVTWTYNNNSNSTYGMADVSSGYSSANYSGITGMWNGSPWTTNTKVTTDTLWNYADADGNVTLTINNNPSPNSGNVVVAAANGDTLYSANGLRSSNYTSQHITSFTVNMNYVTSVTLNSNSILDSSNFTAPKDYTEAFVKTREESVGRIVFLGDSITHGVQDMSWRWGLFKTMVDNGIEYEIAGPLTGYNSPPLNTDYNGDASVSQYGGATFDNAHYAQASGRTHNMLTASNSGNSLGGSTGVNYGGVTSAKVGNEYNGDTYVMMMGTNDILSDGANTVEKMATVTNRLLGEGSLANGTWTNAGVEGPLVGLTNDNAAYRGEWGTMGKIIDNMKMGENDIMYVMPVPTWGVGRTGLHVYADLVPAYNEKLEAWTKAYSDSHTGTVKYVDINRGLVDKTLNGRYLAPDAFFRTTGGDYIHPNEQGALIIAGNLAQGMGLAGRTAGLARSAADAQGWNALAPTINIAAGETQALLSNVFTEDGGYTIDFGAVFGNGATGGWLGKNNALSVSVGDGINTGTLNISEGYISWGDQLLFCQDNSVANNDKIRVAFHNGNVAENVASGYYVWLGDMLIGQGLGNQTGNLVNGVSVSSTGAAATLSGFSYTNTAYAPTTTYTTATPYLVQQAQGNTDMVIAEIPLPSMESHDSGASSHLTDVNFGEGTVTNNEQFATTGQTANGTLKVTRTGTVSTNAWLGAVGTGHTGDVLVNYNNLTSTTASVLTVLNASVTEGDVAVVLDGGTDIRVKNAFGNGDRSFHGVYNGSVGGAMRLEINEATLAGGILMGNTYGTGTISGGTEVIVNAGASIGGDIFAGSGSGGTINGGTAITITGGDISGGVYGGNYNAGTINGGTAITITGGHITGEVNGGNRKEATGSVNGGTTVTVQGNKASIGGNITADTVKLQNVEASGYSDGFDRYAGTITATNLVLDNYTAGLMKATLVTDYVTVSNGTNATIRNLTLNNCSIDADATSTLTLGGEIHSGNTISYTGNLYLEDNTTFNFSNADVYTAAEGAEGVSTGSYIYKVKADSEGHLYSADGSALTTAHTSTFTGAGVVEGKSFFYESATGALIAYGSDATYNITASTVNYSDIDVVSGISMSGGQLNLDKALNAGVTVTATGGTVNLGNGVNLAASSLSFADAESLTINSNGGTGALQLSGDQTAAASILAKATGNGNVTLTGNTTFAGGLTTALTGTLTLNNGVQLNIGGGKTQNVDISSFSNIVLGAGTKVNYHENGAKTLRNISLAGDATFWVNDTGSINNPVTFAGDTNVGEYTLSLTNQWKSTINIQHLVGNGTLKLSAPTNEASVVNINSLADYTGNLALVSNTNAYTINVNTGNKDVHMGAITASGSGASATTLNLAGAHQLTVSGLSGTGSNVIVNAAEMPLAIDLNGNYTYGSTLNANKLVVTGSGTQTLNGTNNLSGVEIGNGATLALGGTTTLKGMVTNSGSLVLNSNVAVDASNIGNFEFKNPGSGNYSGQGIYEGSGYLSNAEVYLVKSNGGSVSGTGSFTGVTATHDDNGNYTFAVSDDATYHINSALTYNDTEMGGATALYIAKGVSLTNGDAASKTKALSGTGTFVINSTLNNTNNGQTLPTNFSMGDSWNGIVQVVGGTMQIGTTINNLTQGDSWVELKGVKGYLGGNNTYAGNIILTNNGETPAMTITSSTSNNTTVLAGKITGDGDIYRTIGNGNTLSFTGDISGWTGTYYNGGNNGYNSGWSTVNFRENATINANFVNTAYSNNCVLTLNYYGDTVVNGTLFYGLGSNTKPLNVNVNGTSVTFNNSATIGTLAASGKTVTLGTNGEGDTATQGNLTIKGDNSTVGNLRVEGGTITLASTPKKLSVQNSLYISGGSLLNANTVQAANSSAPTLEGEGTFLLNQRNLPSGFSLGETWTGSVLLKDVTLSDGGDGNYWMNTLSHEGSVLELSGFTGYDSTWAYQDNTANIRLTDKEDGTAAWTFKAGTATADTYDFSATGKWSGSGTFKTSGTNRLDFSFAGDMADWTGKFDYGSGNAKLTFKGDATEVNAAIQRTGGTLNLVVGEGNGDFAFNNTVTVDKVTVTEGQTASFGTLTTGTIALESNAEMSIRNGGSLTYNTAADAITLAAGSVLDVTALGADGTRLWNLMRYASGAGTVKAKTNWSWSSSDSITTKTNFDLTGDLWVNAKSYPGYTLTVGEGTLMQVSGKTQMEAATLKVQGTLQTTNVVLGHTDVNTQAGHLIVDGGSLITNSVSENNTNPSTLTLRNGGSLQITTDGEMFTGSNADRIAFTIENGKLVADTNNWTLNHDATIGTATVDAVGHSVLTVSGVLSDMDGTHGTLTKTGMGTLVLTGANTYTGTTTVDSGALVASNSEALSHTVLSFSDKTAAESPYRIFAFATDLRFNNSTGALEDAGTQIDGTIKGLDGHRGYVVANTLTIDVDAEQEYAFMHRYDANNQTTDRVEMKINRLVKTGEGTQIIGGDYSEARGFTTNGLVINNGVEVQQGTLHMMTRGIVTTDFNVLAGATLKTTDDNVHAVSSASAVQYNGMVTLHGTEDSAAVLDYTNGSTNIANGLYVDGYGKVINRYDKFQYINGLYNAEGTTTNDITFTRTDTPSNTDDSNAAAIVLTGSGNFAGTVHLSSESVLNDGSAVNEAYGIQMLGEAAKTALANAVVSFEGDNVTVLSFLNADRPLSVAYWDDLAEAYATPMDGTVGGLQGTNGAVYANTLTIGSTENYDFGGSLNITNLVKNGTGTQTLSGAVTYTGTTTIDAGELVYAGGSANLGAVVMHGSASNTTASQLRFSAKDGAESNIYNLTTLEMSSGGNTGKKWLVVDANTTVNITGTTTIEGVGVSINNPWGVAGGGLEVNGILNAAGTIAMDSGNNASTIKGTGTINVAGINISNYNTTTIDGGLTINITSDRGLYGRTDTATLKLGQVTLQALDTDWNLKNTIGTVELIDTEHGTTFEAADGRTITVDKALSGAGSFNKAGAGTVILKGNDTFTGNITITGGTLEMRNADGVTLNHVVTSSGNLVLAGDVNLNMDVDTGNATFSHGVGNTYGYLTSAGMQIATGGTVNIDDVTAWSIGGLSAEDLGLTSSSLTGTTVTLSGKGGKGLWFMNTGEGGNYTYDGTDTNMTAIVINAKQDAEGNRAQLTLDTQDNVADHLNAITVNDTTAAINIVGATISDDGTVLHAGTVLASSVLSTSNGGSAVLQGSGTYDMGTVDLTSGKSDSNRSQFSLPDHVTLDENWTGAVRVSGTASWMSRANLASLVANENSWVEMNGLAGFFDGSNDAISANIIFTNKTVGSETYAFKQNNGYNNKNNSYSGKLKGAGTFLATGYTNGDHKYTFSGDASEWTGTFHSANANHTTTVDISNAFAATLENEAGAMDVHFKEGSGFTGSIKANGGTMTLNSEVDNVAVRDFYINQGSVELNGGKYTTNALFGNEYNAYNGAIVIKNGAELNVDASANFWRFQVNSGEQAGIFVKGQDTEGNASVLTAKLNEGANLTIKALDTSSETGASITGTGTHIYVHDESGSNFTIADADLSVSFGADDKNVTNKLQNTVLTNTGTGTLTAKHSENTLVGVHAENGNVVVKNAGSSKDSLKSVKAKGADVTLESLGDATSLNLTELVIGDSQKVTALAGTKAHVDDSNTDVATIAIAGEGSKLTAGVGAKLNANLTMGDGSTLEVQKGGLELGCSLTLSAGENLVLHGATMTEDTHYLNIYDLYTGVDSFILNGKAITAEGWYSAEGIISSITAYASADTSNPLALADGSSYVIGFWHGTVSIAEVHVPEPSTSVLSLLALAGLAARRKRK